MAYTYTKRGGMVENLLQLLQNIIHLQDSKSKWINSKPNTIKYILPIITTMKSETVRQYTSLII